MSRRSFITSVGITAVSAAIAGCTDGESTETPGASPTTSQAPPTTESETPTEGLGQYSTRAPAYDEVTPSVAIEGFDIELFSDFMSINEKMGIRTDINAFDALVADGSRGFEPGLYVSIGPAIREVVNDSFEEAPRIIYVGENGDPEPVVTGAFGVETMVPARGDYGDGLLFTMPHSHRVGRLLPDGSTETVAEDVGGPPEESAGPFPLGPAGLAYGPEERLYVTDYFGKRLLQISPDGNWENALGGRLAIPSPTKALVTDSDGQFGGDFLVGTFSLDPPESDALYAVSLDGEGEAEEIVGGFTGMEVVSWGASGIFGEELFVPVAGPDKPATGSVYRVSAEGEPSQFATNVDAARVVVDTEEVLGGSAFVTDFTNKGGSGRVWRVTEQ